jgi:hypothetical protein
VSINIVSAVGISFFSIHHRLSVKVNANFAKPRHRLLSFNLATFHTQSKLPDEKGHGHGHHSNWAA